MHGTALFNAMNAFVLGGTLVVLPTPKYDPHQAVKVMLQKRVTRIIVAGDAVVLPLLDEMDVESLPALPDLRLVISSGMRLSDDAKLRIHALGDITVSDFLASTEGGPYAISSTRTATDLPSRFRLTTGAVVLDESMHEVQDQVGAVGVLGYR
jgi:fatty-acyl-CoA synthase